MVMVNGVKTRAAINSTKPVDFGQRAKQSSPFLGIGRDLTDGSLQQPPVGNVTRRPNLLRNMLAAVALIGPLGCASLDHPMQMMNQPTTGDFSNSSVPSLLPASCLLQSDIMASGKSTSFRQFEHGVLKAASIYPTMGLERIPAAIKQLAPSVPLIQVSFTKNTKKGPVLAGRSIGSGIVVDSTHVVTNKHVVSTPDGLKRKEQLSIRVYNQAGQPVEATGKVVAESDKYDLAIVEVTMPSGTQMRPAVFRSNDISQGLPVIAIGNPIGLENTATAGILSQVNVDITRIMPMIEQEYRVPLLLTDTAINPGNSGGALGDMCGAVVGMPSITIPGEADHPLQNLSFAYPAPMIVDYLRGEGLKPTVRIIREPAMDTQVASRARKLKMMFA